MYHRVGRGGVVVVDWVGVWSERDSMLVVVPVKVDVGDR